MVFANQRIVPVLWYSRLAMTGFKSVSSVISFPLKAEISLRAALIAPSMSKSLPAKTP
jgi:hypothetical protein